MGDGMIASTHHGPDLGAALVALDGEVRKLLDMLRRDRRLWEHAADNLPRLAADVYAAVKAQPEPA
jgi:hypothetical protein